MVEEYALASEYHSKSMKKAVLLNEIILQMDI